MSNIALIRINPFSGWSLPAWPTTPKTDQGAIDEGIRRGYLTKLLSAEYCGCGSDAGAGALMAMFPRDF